VKREVANLLVLWLNVWEQDLIDVEYIVNTLGPVNVTRNNNY